MSAVKEQYDGPPVRVGVIGGSGLYKLEGIDVVDVVRPLTVRQVTGSADPSPGDIPRHRLRLHARRRAHLWRSWLAMARHTPFRPLACRRPPTLRR